MIKTPEDRFEEVGGTVEYFRPAAAPGRIRPSTIGHAAIADHGDKMETDYACRPSIRLVDAELPRVVDEVEVRADPSRSRSLPAQRQHRAPHLLEGTCC